MIEVGAAAAQATGDATMWGRWRMRVATEPFSRLPAHEDEGVRATPRYWDPVDDAELDPATEAGREEGVARRFVRSPSAGRFAANW